MCDYGGDEISDAWIRTQRRARRNHMCCECFRQIAKGDRYEISSVIFDGTVTSYKTCLTCVDRYNAHVTAHMEIEEDVPDRWFGELNSNISDCAHEDPRYLTAFRAARLRMHKAVEEISR